jgi:hypothetical protein
MLNTDAIYVIKNGNLTIRGKFYPGEMKPDKYAEVYVENASEQPGDRNMVAKIFTYNNGDKHAHEMYSKNYGYVPMAFRKGIESWIRDDLGKNISTKQTTLNFDRRKCRKRVKLHRKVKKCTCTRKY